MTTPFPDSPYGFGQVTAGSAENATNVQYIAGLPASWERPQIPWNTIETENTSPPTYHWDTSRCDEAIDAMYAAGLNIDFVIQGAPSWHKTQPCGGINATIAADGAAFARALLDHYTARYHGTCPIAAIECGNEDFTNQGLGNARCNDPAFGLPWLKATYQLIKPLYPQVLIGSFCSLSGGYRSDPTYNFPATFWTIFCTGISPNVGSLGYGGTQYCDQVGFHYYSGVNDPIHPQNGAVSYPDWWKAIHNAMQSAHTTYGYPILPVWTTEVGWTASNTPTGSQITPTQQSDYFHKVLESARTSGVVTHVFYFNVHGLYLDGTPTTPRPAYTMEQAYVAQYPQWTSGGGGGGGTVAGPFALRAFGGAVPYTPDTYQTTLSTYAEGVLADTPQGYFRLDETSGTLAHDISGNHFNATLPVSGVTYSAAGALLGDLDTSMTFTASNWLTLPSTLAYANWGAYSVEFWTKGGSGTWLYYLVTYDGSTLRGYEGSNGEVYQTTPDVASLFNVAGSYDEVAIYNHALSEARALAHFTVGGQIAYALFPTVKRRTGKFPTIARRQSGP